MSYSARRRAPRRRLWRHSPRGRRVGPRRHRSRSAPTAALAATALLCAGYLGWEFYGTTWLAKEQQRTALASLTSAWTRQAPSVTRHGVAVDGILRIPRFGSTYAVPLVEGTDPRSLALGVGHMVDSAHPGEPGNVVLAGHRITHGEPFRRLPDLQPGDEVVIDTIGFSYTYRVIGDGRSRLRVRDDAAWVLAASPADPARAGAIAPAGTGLITLLTCAELFHTTDRLVIFGELVRSAPRVSAHPEA